MDQNIVKATSVSGHLEAELVRSLFEAHGIEVWLLQESVGSVLPLNVGPLSRVDVMVPEKQLERAIELLAEYKACKPASED